MHTEPLYRSPGAAQSLWQEYRVYADRIELGTHFGTMTIPFESVESVQERKPLLSQLATGEIFCRPMRLGLKLDVVDFTQHVEIDRHDGLIRRVLITPDDPARFVEVVQKAMTDWREKRASTPGS